jgi:hypothetical protein
MNYLQTCALNSRIEKSSNFCLFCLLTNAVLCGIIIVGFNGPGRNVPDRFSDRYTPYGKFLLLLATLHIALFFP